MTLRLNGVSPKSGEFVGNAYLYVLCGGPCFTILLTIVFWCLIEKYKVIYLYPFGNR